MVEIVLPQELLGLLGVGGKADVARQTIAIDLQIASVGTLQGYLALTAVDDTELRQLTLVAWMGVVEHAMLRGDSGTIGGLVDDAYRLTVWDVVAAIGLWLLDGEVVELGIATLLAIDVKRKEGVTRALEGSELIG